MAIHFHEEDLPRTCVSPTADRGRHRSHGPRPGRDRLCLVQLSDGKGDEHLVRFRRGSDYSAPNLKALLGDPEPPEALSFRPLRCRHHAGLSGDHGGAALLHPHRLAAGRTYTDRHGLKDLVKELLNIDLSKAQQTSDWGATNDPMPSANMRRATCAISTRSRRSSTSGSRARIACALAQACFDFLPARACSISPAGPNRTFSPMTARPNV
jgi:ribonuclease D